MIASPKFLLRLWVDDRGATAIEYGLIVGLIAMAMLVGLKQMAGGTDSMWGRIGAKVAEASKVG